MRRRRPRPPRQSRRRRRSRRRCAAGAWFTLHSLQQDFAAYWIAATARRLGLDPYVNHVGSAEAPDALGRRRPLPPCAVPGSAARGRSVPAAGVAAVSGGEGPLHRGDARRLARGRARSSPTVGGRRPDAIAPSSSWPARSTSRSIAATSSAARSISKSSFADDRLAPAGAPLDGGRGAGGGARLQTDARGAPSGGLGRGRERIVLAAVGAGAALLGCGPPSSTDRRASLEYAREVLPRAALYGEGGTEEMLLPASRF